MRKAKTDANQTEIVKALRAMGASVTSTATIGHGFTDLVVGYRGLNYLVEVKVQKGKLRESQIEFAKYWKGSAVVILRSVDEAINWVKQL